MCETITKKTPAAAEIRLSETQKDQVASPHLVPDHVALCQYPYGYEETISIAGVGVFQVRAVRPSDAPMVKELFAALSPRSVYMRFFSPIKQLSEETVARMTRIDYDQQISLVAVQTAAQVQKMLGLAQVIETVHPQHAEFAIMVRDALHGKGLGACLLVRCLEIAKKRKLKKIAGLVLAENTQMLALGRKLNFSVEKIPQSAEYEMTIAL